MIIDILFYYYFGIKKKIYNKNKIIKIKNIYIYLYLLYFSFIDKNIYIY